MTFFKKCSATFLTFILCSVAPTATIADDTEALLGDPSLYDTAEYPNVMFILDNSGSMYGSRMTDLKEAFQAIMESNTITEINAGVMRFSLPGASVAYPVTNIDADVAGTQTFTAFAEPVDGRTGHYEENDIIESTGDGSITATSSEIVFTSTNRVGIRFKNVNVPHNASISSATLKLHPSQNSSDNMTWKIWGENVFNAPEFSGTNGELSNRRGAIDGSGYEKTTLKSAEWEINTDWVASGEAATVDVKDVVQEIIDFSEYPNDPDNQNTSNTWCYGNDLVLFFEHVPSSGAGSRSVYSSDSTEDAVNPELTVKFETASQRSFFNCASKETYTFTGNSNATAAYTGHEYVSGGGTKTAGNNYYDVAGLTKGNWSGFLFKNLNLGSNAEVSAATFVIYPNFRNGAASANLDGVQIKIYAELNAGGNSDEFGSGTNPSDLISPRASGNPSITYTFPNGAGIEDGDPIEIDITSLFDDISALGSSPSNLAILVEHVGDKDADNIEIHQRSSTWGGHNPAKLVLNSKSEGAYIYTKVRHALVDAVDSLVARGWTPIAGSMYEAARYFHGLQMDIGKRRFNTGSGNNHTNKAVSVEGSWKNPENYKIAGTGSNERIEFKDGGNAAPYYKDPSNTSRCAPNYIILMSDGAANFSNQKCNSTGTSCQKNNTGGGRSIDYSEGVIQTMMQAAPFSNATASCNSSYPMDGPYISLAQMNEAEQEDIIHTADNTTMFTPNSDDDGDKCVIDLAHMLAYSNQTYIDSNGDEQGYYGDNTVNPTYTYTIGFGDSVASGTPAGNFLRTLANKGNGEYFYAETSAGLANAFQEIILSIKDSSNTLTSAGTAVNQYNRLRNRNEVYFALFQPSESAQWLGNLKKYGVRAIRQRGEVEGPLQTEVVSWDPGKGAPSNANGGYAVDVNGEFRDTAQSGWTAGADPELVNGGFAGALKGTNTGTTKNWATRKILTDIGDAGSAAALSSGLYTFDSDNTAITREALGLQTTASAANGIAWALGATCTVNEITGIESCSDDISRPGVIGDPLHSRPLMITYKTDNCQAQKLASASGAGGCGSELDDFSNEAAFKDVIFFGTNEGFIHAVASAEDTVDPNIEAGGELFSFIPESTMGAIGHRKDFAGNITSTNRIYGMDGPITAFVNDEVCVEGTDRGALGIDTNCDPYTLNLGDTGADFAYIYATQRRGGENIYALDVTNPTAPSLMWKKTGGENPDTGFEELGQTWSKPVVGKLSINGNDKDVIFFGGGYDTNQDYNARDTNQLRTGAANEPSADTLGNAVFVLDAHSGDMIAKFTNDDVANMTVPAGLTVEKLKLPAMTYSIPAEISAIDMNLDGYTDQLIFLDQGGQVWRIFINKTTNANDPVFTPLNTGSDNTAGLWAVLSNNEEALDDNDNGTGIYPNARRFYQRPVMSTYTNSTYNSTDETYQDKTYLTASFGSGYRAKPLEEFTEDRIYHLRSRFISRNPPDLQAEAPLTEASLSQVFLDGTQYSVDNTTSGWYTKLDGTRPSNNSPDLGEKSLSDVAVYNNHLIATTYTPNVTNNGNQCNFGGNALIRFFQLDTGTIKHTTELKSGIIPPSASLMLLEETTGDDNGDFNPPSGGGETGVGCIVGLESCGYDVGQDSFQNLRYWYEETE